MSVYRHRKLRVYQHLNASVNLILRKKRLIFLCVFVCADVPNFVLIFLVFINNMSSNKAETEMTLTLIYFVEICTIGLNSGLLNVTIVF